MGTFEARPSGLFLALIAASWATVVPSRACQQDDLGVKTCFAAAALSGGAAHTLNFCEDSQDWVTFNSCAGRSYVLATSSLGLSADTVLELYAPECTTLLTSDDNGGGGLQSRIHWTAPASGPYHLRARQADASIGENRDYDLSITGDTSPCESAALRSAFSGTTLKDPRAALLADGGWVAVMDRYSSGTPTNPSVARYGADGILKWIEGIGTGASRERASGVLQTSDGGVLVAAYIDNVPPGIPLAWLAKLDAAGSLQWSKWAYPDVVRGWASTRSGGTLLVGGSTRPSGVDGKSLITQRLDAGGTTTAYCRYDIGPDPSEYADQEGWAIQEARDGGMLAAGMEAMAVGFHFEPLVMRFSANGTPAWVYLYGTAGGMGTTARWLTEASDGNIYFATNSHLVKLNSLGDVLWGRFLGCAGSVTGLVATGDGGVVLSAPICGSATFMKIDGAGNVAWAAKYGTTGAIPTLGIVGIGPDGGPRLAGWRNTSSSAGGGLLMLTTNGSGLIAGCSQSSVAAVDVPSVTVYRTSPGSVRGGCFLGDTAQTVATSAVASLTSSKECTCAAPPPYAGILSVDRSGGTSRVSWTSSSVTRYDVVRGSLLALNGSGGDLGAALDALPGEACLADNTTALFVDDLHPEPIAGDGRFYLLRPVDDLCFAPGTYDEASPSQVLPRDPSIVSSTSACP